MSIDLRESMSQIHDLEMKYQRGVHQTEMVHRDEDARRYKLRALSLRDENATLKDGAVHHKSQISQLKKHASRLQAQLDEAVAASSAYDARIKSQTDENARLKLELEALKSAEKDSVKTLQEKFALERELNKLKPEIEHLKTQCASYNAVVAERQNLQRQLDSLEIELEKERTSKRKARAEATDAAVSELQSRLAEAEQALASERREKDKAEKALARAVEEAGSTAENFRERLSTQKQKLKDSNAELKKVQAELKSCQTELQRARTIEERPAKALVGNAQPHRKRRIQELSFEDVTIQTPGNDGPIAKRQPKKRAFEQAMVGEKSTFSVTPFLSRTKDLSDESLDVSSPTTTGSAPVTDIVEEVEEESEEPSSSEKAPAKALPTVTEEPTTQTTQTVKPRGRPRTKPFTESDSSKKNMAAAKVGPSSGIMLEKVVEEEAPEGQENKPVEQVGEKPARRLKGLAATVGTANISASDADSKKKKRKLLGGANKTLFDEEEEVVAPKAQKPQLAPGRKLKAPLGGASNAFAGKAFSPLKRDRRGMHASFLA
ncbi:hypothetical protein HJFPF1_03432 [Paramyrothecium foliicola]|nr:hypothetical protein HJFPF1_03432 [Paramyrothecium foliicola]